MAVQKFRFIFGLHNHQPVGNFDEIFRKAFENSYRPFLDVAADHPSIRLNLHLSGSLIEWLEAKEQGYLDRIATMVASGQLEMLTGGFYEPVLAVIPDRDKLGQIQKLNEYIENRFGRKAEGLWLAERVWEPHLAKAIHAAGIKYVLLDDYHFLAAGVEAEKLKGYFITEEENAAVGVYPISQKLRYSMPFQEPEATIDVLHRAAEKEPDAVLVMADDGEKFGLWPGSYERCYGSGKWIERFFGALEQNKDWLETITLGDAFKSMQPRGRVYLPTASYFEMNEWSLPAEAGQRFNHLVHNLDDSGDLQSARPFLRGGTWRNYLSNYEESNWMQKRASNLSVQIADFQGNGNVQQAENARNELWKSQCNCAYWHGIFGGLYLPHLRHAIFKHLIKAELVISDLKNGTSITSADIDLDGHVEVGIATNELKCIVTPVGGGIRELDILAAHFNIVNTLRRYPESYHEKLTKAVAPEESKGGSIHDQVIAKEPNLERLLVVDEHPRYAFLDKFYPVGTTVGDLRYGHGIDVSGLASKPYQVETKDNGVELLGTGLAFGQPLAVSKTVTVEGNQISFTATLENRGDKAMRGLYAIEFNLSMLGGHTDDRYYLIDGDKPDDPYLDSEGEVAEVKEIALVTEWEKVAVTFELEQPTTVWRYPVETVSLSETGFERVYQESAVLLVYPLKLNPDEKFQTAFTLRAAASSSEGPRQAMSGPVA